MKRLTYAIILFMMVPLCIHAQTQTVSYDLKKTDLTGLWTGSLYNDSTQQYHRYEIAITKEKGKYSGYSYTRFHFENGEYYAVKKLNIRIANDGKIVIYDDMLLRHNLPELPEKNSSQLNILSLQQNNQKDVLEGLFVTNHTKKHSPLTGKVELVREHEKSHSGLQSFLQETAPDDLGANL